MDLNDLCMTLVLVNCVWLLAMRPARLWFIKIVAVLAVLGGVWLWRPDRAGYFAVGPWAALIILPMWLQHGTLFLMQQRRLGLARWTSWVLGLLHPSATARSMRRMIDVLSLMYRGEIDAGLELAQRYGINDSGLRHLGMVIEGQISGHWAEFERQLGGASFCVLNDPILLSGQLIATAERGAWEEFKRLCHEVGLSRFSPDQNAALFLRAFALLGDVATVRRVCLSSSSLIPEETREFWTAVAEQVSGAGELASRRLQKLQPHSSPLLRPIIDRQLITPAVGPVDDVLRGQALAELSTARSVIDHEARFAVLSGGTQKWSVMTITFMLVLLAVFLFEVPGGSEDTANLERMGAMVVPAAGTPGEWMNVFTAGFLHFGPIHLALNLVGLLLLGRLVERAWGSIGMLALFLICNVTSAALLPAFTFQTPDTTSVFAGASGGIMGLLGGLWGQLVVGRFTRATPLVRSQFRTASTVILAQCVCDVMTPQVSMTCHLIGLMTGLIGGVMVGLCGGRRSGMRPV